MAMSSLISALEEFYYTSSLYKDKVFGTFEKRNTPLSLIKHPTVLLSPELEYFYSHYHCDAVFGSAADISFTSFESLERRQEGFSSSSNDFGKTMQRVPDWNKHWTVFSDVNDNPIVADTGATGTPVYAAIEAVNYEVIAPSLTVFFQMLTEMLKVTESLKSQQPQSDDIEDWINFREQLETPAKLQRLSEFVDEKYVKAFDNFLYS